MADQNGTTLIDLDKVSYADKDLIFSVSRSIASISKILQQDLLNQDRGCATLTQGDREGLLHALSLVGEQLNDHFEDLDSLRVE